MEKAWNINHEFAVVGICFEREIEGECEGDDEVLVVRNILSGMEW